MSDSRFCDETPATAAAAATAAAVDGRERSAVLSFLREELRQIRPMLPATWPDDALLRADLGVDSLDLVELAARTEQEYGVFIADDDLPRLVSLSAMADWLRAQAEP